MSGNNPDPETGLTPIEKDLVEKSWSLFKIDVKGNGMELFLSLFKVYPEAKTYFPFRDIPDDELPSSGKFKIHAVTVMYSIGSIIDYLNESEILIGLLQKIGNSHAKRKVPEAAFWEIKKCMLSLLQIKLKDVFTDEVKAAWDKTLNVAISIIVKCL